MTNSVPKWASPKISAELPQLRETGETSQVEFKGDFLEQSHRLAKEIAAMASSGGGRIFVGIDDDGELRGLKVTSADERDDLFERAHSIVRTVKPVPKINLSFAVESERTVLVIDIPKQEHPVFYYDSRPYVRDERRSRPAEPDEVVKLVWVHPSSEHELAMERLKLQGLTNFVDRQGERRRSY